MKLESYQDQIGRKILTAMIVDKRALAKLSSEWQGKELQFSTSWMNMIAKWCTQYYEKYGDAPKARIKDRFCSWAAKRRNDDANVGLVELFLAGLSDEYVRLEQAHEDVNSDHIIDLSASYFDEIVNGEKLRISQGLFQQGKIDEAHEVLNSIRRIDLGAGEGIDFLRKDEELRECFEDDDDEQLIIYPGVFGHFVNGLLQRDHLVSFLGPEKSAKSFMLHDMAYHAVKNRKKVAFFEVGDMGRKQVKRRFLTRITQYPARSPIGKWPCVIQYPTEITPPKAKGEIADVVFTQKEFDKPLDFERGLLLRDKFISRNLKSKDRYYELFVYPNSTINVKGIAAKLDQYEIEYGWVPDVVIIDYADILDAPAGTQRLDERQQINKTWKQLRSLSQERHILVITATQANRESYTKTTLDRRNISEDKRKLAHVNGVIGINSTSDEKDKGIIRFNIIAERDREYSAGRVVYAASCLALANPVVVSCSWKGK